MDIELINLEISSINFVKNENKEIIIINWNSNIGFGNYTIYKEKEQLIGESEYMDNNDDKIFITKLLKLLKEKINIDISKLKIRNIADAEHVRDKELNCL